MNVNNLLLILYIYIFGNFVWAKIIKLTKSMIFIPWANHAVWQEPLPSPKHIFGSSIFQRLTHCLTPMQADRVNFSMVAQGERKVSNVSREPHRFLCPRDRTRVRTRLTVREAPRHPCVWHRLRCVSHEQKTNVSLYST